MRNRNRMCSTTRGTHSERSPSGNSLIRSGAKRESLIARVRSEVPAAADINAGSYKNNNDQL